MVAVELSHNWGVKVLGGEWESHFAAPSLYQSLRMGGSASSNEGFANINLVPFDVLNHKGMCALELRTRVSGHCSHI